MISIGIVDSNFINLIKDKLQYASDVSIELYSRLYFIFLYLGMQFKFKDKLEK